MKCPVFVKSIYVKLILELLLLINSLYAAKYVKSCLTLGNKGAGRIFLKYKSYALAIQLQNLR